MADNSENILEDIQKRLILLEDERAIRNLLSEYSYLADTCQDGDWADLFADDAVLDLTSLDGFLEHKQIRGKADITRYICGPDHHDVNAYGRAMHLHGSSFAVVIDGNTASAQSYSLNIRHENGKLYIHDAASNDWRFIKIEGKWYFRQRKRRRIDDPEYIKNVIGLRN